MKRFHCIKRVVAFSFIMGLLGLLSCDDNSTKDTDDSTVNNEPGLVAYYSLDGNADDAGSSHSDGVVSGAISAHDRHDQVGKAMYFNGNSDFISVNDTSNFQFDDSLTVTAWVRTDSLKSQIVVRKGGGLAVPVFELYLAGNGDRGFRIGTNFTYKSGGYPLQTWMHLAGTYDGESMIFYINGSPVDTLQKSNALTSDKNLLLIGTRTGLNADTFAGRLDDIRIYSRALSLSEIAAMAAE